MSTHLHGYDCMCGGVHPLPTGPPGRTPAQATSSSSSGGSGSGSGSGGEDSSSSVAAAEVAPVPSFLSSFSEAQEVATRNVLAQIHPDLAVSRTALTLLMRIQDALAHYLLLRAFNGHNPAHRPGRGPNAPAEDELMEEHADTFALQESDPSHAIHFVFPSSVYAPQLCTHADAERAKAVRKFVSGEVHQLPQPDFFQFSQEVALRWFSDFQTGIERGESGDEAKAQAKRRAQAKEEAEERRTGKKKAKAKASGDAAAQAGAGSSESKEDEAQTPPSLALLPEVMQTPLEQISLAAMVEYLAAELLELGGNRALDRGAGCLQPLDIWVSIAQDEELRSLIKFLRTCWSTSGSDALASPLDAALTPADAPAESFGLPPLTLLLEAEFAMAQKALATVNAGSWYNNMAKVKEYARAFARGDMRTSAVSRALAELQVRPLQFYGCDNHTLLSEKPPEQEHWAQTGADAWSFVRFGITDRAEHEWQFLLEIAPNQSWKGCVSELAWAGAAVGFLQRSSRDGADTLNVNLSACSSIGDEAGRVYQPRVTDVDELEAEIVAQLAKLKEKLDAHRKSKEEANKTTATAPGKDSSALPSVEPVQRVVEALVDTVAVAAERDQAENGEERKESDGDSGVDAASRLTLGSLTLNDSSSSSSSSSSASVAAPAAAASSSSSSAGSFDPFAIFAPAARKAPAKPSALAKLKLARAGVAPGDVAAAAAAAAAAVPKPPTLMLGSTSRLSSLSTLLGSVPTHVSNSQVQSELEGTVARILHIALFSRYGPTFYTNCHPAAARRAFTVELLDEAMAIAPTVDMSAPADGDAAAVAPVSASAVPAATPSPALPQLPIVLLDLIAQYHSFDLPFIEDEAAKQLKSANWLSQPANRASYAGQTNNPVERLGQLQTEADEILEPIELEPIDGEEGEDEEFDEDEEEDDEEFQ